MKLEWSEISKPTTECCYTHTIAETPFGRFQLTWKGWKEDISASMGFDETPWGDVVYDWWGSIDEAKQWAEDEMNKRLTELAPTKIVELELAVSMLRDDLVSCLEHVPREISDCINDTLDKVEKAAEAGGGG